MATSNTELVNLALIPLGKARISSLATDQGESAKICRDKWPEVRDAVLRGNDWRCLIKRTQLAREAAAPAFGYLYQYALPVDYFRMLNLSVTAAVWEIEGRVLLTDEETVSIRYIGYDTNTDPVALFDPLLTTALAARMAAEIAPALDSADRVAEMWALYDRKLAEAVRTGAVEKSRTVASCTALTTDVR